MMGFFKKKDVPSELPDLISDEINKQLSKEFDNEDSSTVSKSDSLIKKEENSLYRAGNSEIMAKKAVVSDLNNSSNSEEEVTLKKLPTNDDDDTGYFKALMKSVMEEDLGKTNNWKNKLMSKDVVSNMREYWQKQSPEVILNSLGGETKANLLKQVDKLHLLEKEWQSNYLSLMACEDKIRDEEKKLKGSLAEFVSLYKRTLNRKRK